MFRIGLGFYFFYWRYKRITLTKSALICQHYGLLYYTIPVPIPPFCVPVDLSVEGDNDVVLSFSPNYSSVFSLLLPILYSIFIPSAIRKYMKQAWLFHTFNTINKNRVCHRQNPYIFVRAYPPGRPLFSLYPYFLIMFYLF